MNKAIDGDKLEERHGCLLLKNPEDHVKFPHLVSRGTNWQTMAKHNPAIAARWIVKTVHDEHVPGITRTFRGHNLDAEAKVEEMLREHPWLDPISFVRRTTEGSLRIKCCYVSIIEGWLLTEEGKESYRRFATEDLMHEALEASGYSLGT